MFESFKPTNDAEESILRKLRVWIAALGAVCVLTGIGIGAILAGRTAVAQDQLQLAARGPDALSASFVEIARHVEPAVVNIDTLQATADIAETDNDDKTDKTPSNPLYEMFRRQPPRPMRGVGSGFIIDPKGYIVTNNHVIDDASRITVSLLSGERYRGRVIGVDRETDIALIKIDSDHALPVMKFGDSNAVQVGDWVLAIGSPFGLDQTVTAGIISKKERDSTAFATSFQRFLQTDAAINRGNSGGPLVNMHGEVIGVNSQIATLNGDYNGIGFALPSNDTKYVCDQLLANGKVKRGYLGVTLDSVKSEFARVYSLPDAHGAIIADIQSERDNGEPTPAVKAGLHVNDIITEFNGQPVQDAQDLIAKVAGASVGQTVSLTFLRDVDGKLEKHAVSVALAERPELAAGPETIAPRPKAETAKSNSARLGLTLSELTPQLIADKRLNGVKGLFVKEVDPNGLAADVRPNEVTVGEVITRINRVPVTTLAEFQRVIDSLKPGDAIVLNLSRFDRRADRIVQRIVQFTYE
jgi:serine protease Do